MISIEPGEYQWITNDTQIIKNIGLSSAFRRQAICLRIRMRNLFIELNVGRFACIIFTNHRCGILEQI